MKVTGDPATEPVGAPTSSTGSNEATEGAPTAEAGDDSANWNRRGAASSLSELARLGSFLVFNGAAFLRVSRYLPKGQMGW